MVIVLFCLGCVCVGVLVVVGGGLVWCWFCLLLLRFGYCSCFGW